jgi:hypothetical protein
MNLPHPSRECGRASRFRRALAFAMNSSLPTRNDRVCTLAVVSVAAAVLVLICLLAPLLFGTIGPRVVVHLEGIESTNGVPMYYVLWLTNMTQSWLVVRGGPEALLKMKGVSVTCNPEGQGDFDFLLGPHGASVARARYAQSESFWRLNVHAREVPAQWRLKLASRCATARWLPRWLRQKLVRRLHPQDWLLYSLPYSGRGGGERGSAANWVRPVNSLFA